MPFLEGTQKMLKEAINSYPPAELRYEPKDRASLEHALSVLEEDYNCLGKIHHMVHRMRRHVLLAYGLLDTEMEENHGKRRRLRETNVELSFDFCELKENLPRVSREAVVNRQVLAIEVALALTKLTGSGWAIWLSLLANAKGAEAVVEPVPTPEGKLPECWRGKDTWLNEDKLALELFTRLNELIEDEEGVTRRKLRELEPPLTWGEVLYYFYYSLQEKGDEAHKEAVTWRKELDRLFYPPGQHYCFCCDKPFTVTKYHPYRSLCSSCVANKRMARYRERKRQKIAQG
jgi:hypothetical protein